MNKSLSFFVYAGLWLLLVLAQTFVTSGAGDAPSVFASPEHYYSIWAVDLYLILLFYANYYVFAPKMIRRRLFAPYIGLVAVAALIGFLIPIVLYSAWQWTMPGVPVGTMPLSLLGVIGAIAAMSLGLAVRSVLEWIKLEDQHKLEKSSLAELEQSLSEQTARAELLEQSLHERTAQLEQLEQSLAEQTARVEQLSSLQVPTAPTSLPQEPTIEP